MMKTRADFPGLVTLVLMALSASCGDGTATKLAGTDAGDTPDSGDYVDAASVDGSSPADAADPADASLPLSDASLTNELQVDVTTYCGSHVVVTPPGEPCYGQCSYTLGALDTVTITPMEDAAGSFAGFSGDCSGAGSCQLLMSAPHSVGAVFDSTTALVTVATDGTPGATLTSDPPGIDCASCSHEFAIGCDVEITPVSNPQVAFVEFGGDCAGPSCDLTVDGSTTVSAEFETLVQYQWSHIVGSAGRPWLTTNSGGDLFMAAIFSSDTIDVGGGPLSPVDQDGGTALAKYDSNGNHQWSKALVGSASQLSLAVDASDNLFLAGTFRGTLNLGSSTITAVGVERDVFVAKFDGDDGSLLWAEQVGSTYDEWASAMAVTADGDPIVAGRFEDTTDIFGDEWTPLDDEDVVLFRLNGTNGDFEWSLPFGGVNNDSVFDMRIDNLGQVAVVGFGTPSDDRGLFLATRSASDGSAIWDTVFTSTGVSNVRAVTQDADGTYFVAGSFQGQLQIGDLADNTALNNPDMFVAAFDESGDPEWLQAFGGLSADRLFDIERISDDRLGIVGTFAAEVTIGSTTLTNAGDASGVVAALSTTDGTPQWAFGFLPQKSGAHAIVSGPGGQFHIGGDTDTPADVGGGLTSGHPAGNLFVSTFGP